MKFSDMKQLVQQTVQEWSDDDASQLAASMAYYTVFSIPPLLILFLVAAGRVFNQAESDVRARLINEISDLMGESGAAAIEGILENASQPGGSIIAVVVGVATLLFGASNVFGQLHKALNKIWNVETTSEGIMATIKARFFSFTMVFGVGFLLLVSLVISSLISSFNEYISTLLPFSVVFVQVMDIVVSVGIITVLFGLVYKIVPNVEVAWRDVWIGALFTAVLFTLGKLAIGFYLGNSAPASSYGAAGSLIVILLWVYYSTQILFFGAEFTQVYANRFGSKIVADATAVIIDTHPAHQDSIPLSEATQLPRSAHAVHAFPAPATLSATSTQPSQLPAPLQKVEQGVGKLQQGTVKLFGGALAAWHLIRRRPSR